MKDTRLSQYNELAERRNAAYAAFSSMFVLQNPKPDKPRPPVEDGLTIIQLLVLLMATVIVSASRTLSEFGEVGGAAVIMLELGVISYAFIHTSLYYNARRPETLKRLLAIGMGLAFVVLLTANIDKVMRGANVEMSDEVKTAFNLVLAVSAPTLAFITGDLLGVYVTKAFRQWKKDKAKYDAALERWRNDLNEAFKVYAPRLNATIKVEREDVSTESNVQLSNGRPMDTSNGQSYSPSASTLGHSKVPDASKRVHEFYAQNERALWDENMGVRRVADMLGVGRQTVSNVRAVLRAQVKAVNGHGESHE